MRLTGSALVVVLAALLVALVAVTMLAWPRFSDQPRYGMRVVLLAANQIAAVLLVGAIANDVGNLYGSWTELFAHASTPSREASTSPATLSGTGRITVGTDPRFASRAQWPTRGRLESVTISGATSGLSSHAYVYLPPQYFQAGFAHTRFPGVEVLTGYPGRDTDLIEGINYPAAMRRLLDTHQVQPMVLVMMRPAVVFPRDTECTDVPGGPQVLTFFAADVPAATAHAYRVRVPAWGAAGLSTGAHCATKLAMLYPNQFPAAASMSGYYTALRDDTTGDLWGGSSLLRDLNNLEWRLKHLPPPAVSLLMTIGTHETGAEGIPDSKRFLALVKPPMQASLVFVPGGRHNTAGFAREVAPTLLWLSQRLPPP